MAHANDVLIFAAASTAVALEKVIHKYGKASDDRVRASYASSGTLARQVSNGAPAALYLSANTKWMDWVEKKKLLVVGTRTHLLQNRLVLVQSSSEIIKLVHRGLNGWLTEAQKHRIAVADPAQHDRSTADAGFVQGSAVVGPDGGIGQKALWHRVRSSAAVMR